MPRKLPWLAGTAVKKETTRAAPRPRPKATHGSLSPADLVGSDLEDLDHDGPTRSSQPEKMEKEKEKRYHRPPSSSPPPVPKEPPPDVKMIPGYEADDVWLMVEDEFYSTAQLWTQHLHQQEYVRLKKLHKSRGQDTLDALTRGTDGRTAQSREVQLKAQAAEMAKKRKRSTGGDSGSEGEEDEDDFMFDPQLAGLMTGSSQMASSQRRPKLATEKARKALAEDGSESSEPLPELNLSDIVEEQEEDEETDSDDLDAPQPKAPTQAQVNLLRPFASSSSDPLPDVKPPPPRILPQLAQLSNEKRRSIKPESPPSSPPPRLPSHISGSPVRERIVATKHMSHSAVTNASRASGRPAASTKDGGGPRASSFLAKRRAQKEKEAAEARQRAIEDIIPTFLI